MTITPEELVRREVCYCASGLIHTLASGNGHGHEVREVENLTEQAAELFYPIPDYESAAKEAGWSQDAPGALWVIRDGRDDDFTAETAEEACITDDIEPHDREVFEHWIVTDWLADQLEARGEKVDKDFAGLTIWARTTTGQAIYLDPVIEDICADLNRPLDERLDKAWEA